MSIVRAKLARGRFGFVCLSGLSVVIWASEVGPAIWTSHWANRRRDGVVNRTKRQPLGSVLEESIAQSYSARKCHYLLSRFPYYWPESAVRCSQVVLNHREAFVAIPCISS